MLLKVLRNLKSEHSGTQKVYIGNEKVNIDRPT